MELSSETKIFAVNKSRGQQIGVNYLGWSKFGISGSNNRILSEQIVSKIERMSRNGSDDFFFFLRVREGGERDGGRERGLRGREVREGEREREKEVQPDQILNVIFFRVTVLYD